MQYYLCLCQQFLYREGTAVRTTYFNASKLYYTFVMDRTWEFNNALNPKDKEGGLPIPFSYLTSFNNCTLQCDLAECTMKGCKFTWRKKGMAINIDKVLVNQVFLHSCPDLSAIAFPTDLSYHTLILVIFKEGNKQDRDATFRYINNQHHGLKFRQNSGYSGDTVPLPLIIGTEYRLNSRFAFKILKKNYKK